MPVLSDQKKMLNKKSKKNIKDQSQTQLAEIIADNESISGVLSGVTAMKTCGMQTPFAVANMEQAIAANCIIILRAGKPPRNDIDGAPKPITIKTNTIHYDLIQGTIPKDPRFNRMNQYGMPKPHHPKDAYRLSLPENNWHHQHTKQLTVRLDNLINSDTIYVVGFNEKTGDLCLAYRNGTGPNGFNGQFVINLHQGTECPRIFSREWDNLEFHSDWDSEKQVITKPKKLAKIPDELYQKVFNQTFALNYTKKKGPIVNRSALIPFEVFATQPNTAEEFKQAMGTNHPHYSRIAKYKNLMQILRVLDKKTIKEVYDKAGKIILGDWDGLAISHANTLDKKYTEVLNTFDMTAAENQQQKLLNLSEEYLKKLKIDVAKKEKAHKKLSAFEQQIKAVSSIKEIISPLALAQAGYITPHGFVFKELINHAYRDPSASFYGEEYNMQATQDVFDYLLNLHNSGRLPKQNLEALAQKTLQSRLLPEDRPSDSVLKHLATHIVVHLRAAITLGEKKYQLPNTWHDMNINDPYKHGWEMDREDTDSVTNKCNLDGAWVMFTPDGCMLYGTTQKQLVDVLMSGNGALLKDHHIAVNHAVDMSLWAPIIKKQIELGQVIKPKTLQAYLKYNKEHKDISNLDKENIAPPTVEVVHHKKGRPLFFNHAVVPERTTVEGNNTKSTQFN